MSWFKARTGVVKSRCWAKDYTVHIKQWWTTSPDSGPVKHSTDTGYMQTRWFLAKECTWGTNEQQQQQQSPTWKATGVRSIWRSSGSWQINLHPKGWDPLQKQMKEVVNVTTLQSNKKGFMREKTQSTTELDVVGTEGIVLCQGMS